MQLAARQGRIRYGEDAAPATERLQARVRAHRFRIRLIDEQVAELEAERKRLGDEVVGFEKGLALVLAAETERRAARFGEAWSPIPIRGYRVWRMIDGRLSGARMVWPTPELVARCARGGDVEVPHTDDSCRRPQCGIYAAKSPDLLIEELLGGTRGVMGLVELSGKVVEHEKGYRARQARVVALGAVGGARLLLADDAVTIAEVFATPDETLRIWGKRRDRRPALAELTEFLLAREEATPWT